MKNFFFLNFNEKPVDIPALSDKNLTWREMGFLAHILTKDIIERADLIGASADGEASVKTLTSSLIQKGYGTKIKIIDKRGRAVKWFFVAFSTYTEVNEEVLAKIIHRIKTQVPKIRMWQVGFRVPNTNNKLLVYNISALLRNTLSTLPNDGKDAHAVFKVKKPLGFKKRYIPEDTNTLFENGNGYKAKQPRGKIGELIKYWNALGVRKHLDPNTKVYKSAASGLRKLLNGTFFMDGKYKGYKFSVSQIKTSMENFAICTLDSNFKPYNKKFLKRLSLPEFLYDPKASEVKSQFIHLLENRPEPMKLYRDMLTDKYPKITSRLMTKFNSEGNDTIEMNQFIRASRSIKDFIEQNKDKLIVDVPVPVIVDALVEITRNGNGLSDPFKLTTPYTLNTLLPQKLKQQKHMKGRR